MHAFVVLSKMNLIGICNSLSSGFFLPTTLTHPRLGSPKTIWVMSGCVSFSKTSRGVDRVTVGAALDLSCDSDREYVSLDAVGHNPRNTNPPAIIRTPSTAAVHLALILHADQVEPIFSLISGPLMPAHRKRAASSSDPVQINHDPPRTKAATASRAKPSAINSKNR